MAFQWYTYHLLTLLSTIVVVLLFIYLLEHRKKTGAIYTLCVFFLMFAWIICQGLEFASLDMDNKIFLPIYSTFL